MILKIYVPKTDFFVEINAVTQIIFINDTINWSVKAYFEKIKEEVSLDENGDVFEPLYKFRVEVTPKRDITIRSSYEAKELKKEITEIQTLLEFLEENTKEIFNQLDFRGVLG
uniref:hypothetical protein n=1 Tax=Streptococcus pluranimalium TaxID=82348 RepID=UPI003F68F326